MDEISNLKHTETFVVAEYVVKDRKHRINYEDAKFLVTTTQNHERFNRELLAIIENSSHLNWEDWCQLAAPGKYHYQIVGVEA